MRGLPGGALPIFLTIHVDASVDTLHLALGRTATGSTAQGTLTVATIWLHAKTPGLVPLTFIGSGEAAGDGIVRALIVEDSSFTIVPAAPLR
jgi:hypothetical protein